MRELSDWQRADVYKAVLCLVPSLCREIRKSRSALIKAINAGLEANGVEPIEFKSTPPLLAGEGKDNP